MLPDVTTLALTCLVLLGAGYVLIGCLSLIPSCKSFTSEVWPILFTETLIVGVAVAAIWVGGAVTTLALLLMAGRVGYEAAEVVQMRRAEPHSSGQSIVFGVSLALLCFMTSYVPLALTSWLAAIAMLACIFASRTTELSGGLRSLMLDIALFPAIPVMVFVAAGIQGGHAAWLLIAFLLVETFDSYALAGGKLFGRHKAFPVLSPKKTIEGLVIGSSMLILTAAIAGAMLTGAPVLLSAAVALLVGGLAVAGDLTASRLKRRSNVKDFPSVLPHQGGLLDIIDAWIVVGAGLVVVTTLFGLA